MSTTSEPGGDGGASAASGGGADPRAGTDRVSASGPGGDGGASAASGGGADPPGWHRPSEHYASEPGGDGGASPGAGSVAWEARRGDNQAWWDAVVPAHVAGRFYDRAGFVADPGRVTARPFEVAEVGSVSGLDLCHLQCHFGMDTLSWARLGARVWGLDVSAAAIAAAGELAAEVGLADQSSFVVADVYDAVSAFAGRRFDAVYTGLGALCWLDDVARWATVVAALLRPGGFLYLAEFHPITAVFGDESLFVERDYFAAGALTESDDFDYGADGLMGPGGVTHEWQHTLASVLGSLSAAGLVVEHFAEHDYTLFARWPFLVRDGDRYVMPPGHPSLPLMYSLRARLPG